MQYGIFWNPLKHEILKIVTKGSYDDTDTNDRNIMNSNNFQSNSIKCIDILNLICYLEDLLVIGNILRF